jgi:MFS family permease
MRRIAVLSLGNFFSAAHFFLIIYILAPYLATLMPAAVSGLAISIGAIITLVVFPFLPREVAKYGPQKLGIIFAVLEICVLLALSFNPTPLLAVLLAALACAISPFIAYQLDLLLEGTVTDEGMTGRIRSAFLTAGNVALVLAPIVVGLLLDTSEEYGRIFLIAALTLIPFVLLMARQKLPHPELSPMKTDVKTTCLCIARDPDLRAIALASATIQLFFHLAPLYIPLYLHNELGIPWSELGWMFSVMLIPFVLFEYPAGWLADTRIGDRRILATGFVLTGLALAATGFITEATPLGAIVSILVLSRTGAALVESMVEGHFFRRVSASDANTVSVFRMMRPGGALLAPVIGSVLLSVGSYTTLFTVTGVGVLLLGLWSARSIQDPRSEAGMLCLLFGACHRGRA